MTDLTSPSSVQDAGSLPVPTAFSRHQRIALGTIILLVAVVFLVSRNGSLSMGYSEVFSVFHTAGSYQQVFDPDLAYPPGFYVSLYWWSHLVGRNDFALYMLATLSGLITVACMVQIGRRAHSWPAGWIAAFAFATSSYATYYMLELRATSLALTALALVTWMHLRWLDRPTLRRSILYAVGCTLALYMHYYLGAVLILLGLHAILTNWRLWWRWLLIMISGGALLLPMIPPLSSLIDLFLALRKKDTNFTGYYVAPLATFFQAVSARLDVVLTVVAVLTIIGGLFISLRNVRSRATLVGLLSWAIGVPLLAYFTRERFGLFTTRYLFFTVVGIYALIGFGLAAFWDRLAASLPVTRVWRSTGLIGLIALIVLALAPWQPFDLRTPYTDSPPVKDMVIFLNRALQPGDALVVDPNCACGDPLIWWYYESLYAPQGIRRTPPTSDLSNRVWYLARQGIADQTLIHKLEQGRHSSTYFGPWYFIVTLYEGQPQPTIAIGDHIHFSFDHTDEKTFYRVGDTLNAALWWSVDQSLDLDYSISLQVINPVSGQVIAQTDGPPHGEFTPNRTSEWQKDQTYRDDRRLELPFDMQGGSYELRLIVYQSWDGKRLPIVPTAGSQSEYLVIKRFEVVSYNRG